jgi:hypothetical protein
MSKTFHVAAGGLLLLLGAVLGWTALQPYPNAFIARWLAVGAGGAGAVLLAMGLRSPFHGRQLDLVRRRFQPANLVLGPLVVAAGVGLVYLRENVTSLLPEKVVVVALLAVPVGVFITASVFADHCGLCGAKLKDAWAAAGLLIPFAGDVSPDLRSASPRAPLADAARALPVEYCPRCRGIAVFDPGGGVLVLRGSSADRLIGRVLGEDRFHAAPDAAPPAPRVDAVASARANARWASFVALVAGGAFVLYGALEARGLVDERRTWRSGRRAPVAEVVVEEKAQRLIGSVNLPFYRYRLRISYRTGDGGTRHAEQDVISWFERADAGPGAEVRYLAEEPTRIAVSTVATLRYGPFVWAAFAVALGILFLCGSVAAWRRGPSRKRPPTRRDSALPSGT